MVLNNINQKELGRLLNVSQPVISRILKGTKPSLKLEQRIHKLINLQ
ncbi:helix-turn-helix domain-containing protein [Neobacillus drentensis]